MATSPPPPDESAHDVLPGPCAETVVVLDAPYRLEDLFTRREIPVAEWLQTFTRSQAPERQADLIRAMDQGFRGLAALVQALRSYPSLRDRGTLGRRERSGETLMQKLLEAGTHAVEWSLPTKAIISRTFGIAKVNFWTAMRYAVQACETQRDLGLEKAITEAVEEAVYTRLAEELYGSFVTSRATSADLRRAAIEALIDLWDGRVGFATYRFCPLLRSAWAARCRAPRAFGTMMGTSEIFGLLFADCDSRFVEALTQGEDPERLQAFEEFLFDLPYESLARVRARMQEDGKSVVGAETVATYLGLASTGLRPLIDDPKALYTSFRTRRVKSQYRLSMGVPGPKRTAEGYVLEALLREEAARIARPARGNEPTAR
jgi:hypothetical protein